MYAVVQQGETKTQGLVCAKSRLAKQNLTIPRLELVSAHIATNLVSNVERVIGNYEVNGTHCWSDSTVALYWINGQGEYVRSLRERHVNAGGKQASCPRKGSAVIIADESKNRNTWKLGIVSDLIKGKDNVIRGAKVRTANGVLERAIQHLYLLELSIEEKNWEPNPSAPTFIPRPKRDAAVAADLRMQQHAQTDRDDV